MNPFWFWSFCSGSTVCWHKINHVWEWVCCFCHVLGLYLFYFFLKFDCMYKIDKLCRITSRAHLKGDTAFHLKKLKIITYLWTKKKDMFFFWVCFTCLYLLKKERKKGKGSIITIPLFFVKLSGSHSFIWYPDIIWSLKTWGRLLMRRSCFSSQHQDVSTKSPTASRPH